MHPETPSDPEPQSIEFRDQPLAYTDEGEGSQVVVAVPGLPGSIRDFRWLAPALSETFRVIRVELPGYGHSGRRGFEGMSIRERAEPVRALLDKLQIRSAQLLGHNQRQILSF